MSTFTIIKLNLYRILVIKGGIVKTAEIEHVSIERNIVICIVKVLVVFNIDNIKGQKVMCIWY